MAVSTPIALCTFNRPDCLARVLAVLREVQPTTLLIFGDEPRPGHRTDAGRVKACRRLVLGIDWDCDVKTLYAEKNLGCRIRVSSGISWAFNHTERLIILEEDCVPHPDFFPYCEELLERYEHDKRVMAVSGNTFEESPPTEFSYYFSKYPHCWGWATWKRAWGLMDLNLSRWEQLRDTAWLERIADVPEEVEMCREVFDKVRAGEIDSWAFPWKFSCWVHGGLTALPGRNLVSNIGFGPEATHTKIASPLANMPTFPMGVLQHPETVTRCVAADMRTFAKAFRPVHRKPTWWRRARRLLRIPGWRHGPRDGANAA